MKPDKRHLKVETTLILWASLGNDFCRKTRANNSTIRTEGMIGTVQLVAPSLKVRNSRIAQIDNSSTRQGSATLQRPTYAPTWLHFSKKKKKRRGGVLSLLTEEKPIKG